MKKEVNINYQYSFEKLEVWQMASKIRNEIYKLSNDFPDNEKYGIVNQIRRASNRITDNLAEGSGRASNIDRAHFTNMAYSSALEVLNQLITCQDLKYISNETYNINRIKIENLIKKLNTFYKYQLNQANSLKNKIKN